MKLPISPYSSIRFRIFRACCLISLSIMPASAMARGFYGVLDTGQSSFDNNICEDLLVSMRCSTTATAIRLGVGYQFSQNYGIEVDYDYLGNRKMLRMPYSPPSASGKENWNVLQVGVIRTIPLPDDFSFFGKLGVAEVWVDYTYNEYYQVTGRHGPWPLFSGGLGVQHDISNKFAVRAQYEYFNGLNIVSKDIGFSLSSIGVVLKF